MFEPEPGYCCKHSKQFEELWPGTWVCELCLIVSANYQEIQYTDAFFGSLEKEAFQLKTKKVLH